MLNKDTQGFHAQDWQQAVAELSRQAHSHVLVTVLGTAGSTPRGQGTKMVVTASDIYATVGGGHLEFNIITQARELLATGAEGQQVQHFPLGASLGQCCGGSVTVLFECFMQQRLPVELYGAGHVAHALVGLLSQLPVSVRWIDSRAELFPEQLADNITPVVDAQPDDAVADARPGSAFIILTHNHQLDYALTERILKRKDAAFLGVIGSETKARRFRMRLQHRGFNEHEISTMTCPVGLPDVTGKLPMEVAVSIAGQLIQLYQQPAENTPRQGLQWRDLKQALSTGPDTSVDTPQEIPHD